MSAIHGRYIDGKVIFDPLPEWPEGLEVSVRPLEEEYVGIGMREEDWPTTPEGIAELIATMEQIQPFLTPEEDEEWRKQLAVEQAQQKAMWDKWTKDIGGQTQ